MKYRAVINYIENRKPMGDICIYDRRWLAAFLDDCSRFAVALEFFKHGTARSSTSSAVGKPATLGKVERFNRTFKELYPRFSFMDCFIEHYNYEKPHRGLNYAPASSTSNMS